MSKFSYDEWVKEQAEKIASATNRLALAGIFEAAVYAIPSAGSAAGELIVSTKAEPYEVVRFGPHGSRVSSVPRSHLHSLLWNACRRLPVCPCA